MKIQILILAITLSTSNLCFADGISFGYNDYGYSYGTQFNPSMHIREMENDWYKAQSLMKQSDAINAQYYNRPAIRLPQTIEQSQTQMRSGAVIDKPLSLKGIYPYDAYGN